MIEPNSTWIIVNGTFHKQEEPLVPVGSRAVRYGDGCFETLRVYRDKFLKLESHLQRLRGALEYLRISPPVKLNSKTIKKLILDLLDKNSMTNREAIARIQIWREGPRGFNVPANSGSGYTISVSALPDISESVTLATVSTRRIPSESLNPRFKLSNSINYIRAAIEAAEQSADDALMLTVDGYVAETTIANLFWLKNESVYTPSEQSDILPGITRSIILEILQKEFDVTVEESEFTIDHLVKSEAVWICNSVRELVPVKTVDKNTFNVDHPFIEKLSKAFVKYRNNELR